MKRSEFLKLAASAGLLSCLPISCLDISPKETFKNGFQIKYKKELDESLLMKLFGEFNE